MATTASLVKDIRRLLGDRPIRAKLTGAISDTTTETFSVSSTHAQLFNVGELWEHADDTGEIRDITAVDLATPQITGVRGAYFSTAATHSNATYLEKYPRWRYDLISDAVDQVLDNDLWPYVYEIVEHQVTTSTTTTAYNSPATTCEKFLSVYQRTASTDDPTYKGITYSVYPQNVDTTLWANGKVFYISGGKRDGSEKYYVNCAHRLSASTLLTRQETLVRMRACQYLLEWTAPGRLQGPTNQGDRTVRPGDELRTAAYYEQEFRRHLRSEATWLREQVPPRQLFKRAGRVQYYTGTD